MSKSQTRQLAKKQANTDQIRAAISTLDLELEAEIERYQNYKLKKNSLKMVELPPMPFSETSLTVDNKATEEIEESVVMMLSTPATEKSIAKEEDIEQSFKSFFLNPVTIFSLLFCLFGSGLLGAVLMSRLMLKWLNNPDVNTANVAESSPNPVPNLATDEVSLDLKSVPQIKPHQEAAAPSDIEIKEDSSSSKTTPSSNLATVLLLPTEGQETEPLTVKFPENMNLTYFYVVTKYKNNISLKKAQSLVKDAYLVNLKEGLGIILAAYDRQKDAELFSQQLKQKGLSSFIYQPAKADKKNPSPSEAVTPDNTEVEH